MGHARTVFSFFSTFWSLLSGDDTDLARATGLRQRDAERLPDRLRVGPRLWDTTDGRLRCPLDVHAPQRRPVGEALGARPLEMGPGLTPGAPAAGGSPHHPRLPLRARGGPDLDGAALPRGGRAGPHGLRPPRQVLLPLLDPLRPCPRLRPVGLAPSTAVQACCLAWRCRRDPSASRTLRACPRAPLGHGQAGAWRRALPAGDGALGARRSRQRPGLLRPPRRPGALRVVSPRG